ncbi:hypothetical protein [Cohnella luojiensis]|uniref:Uncharacterized protein n=1 Tax=Cohnella luojiensis TaxID=652876 RepID=A0A4Y8LPD1_9BACL|nr:hypothetical protein [Cohnella luojiensis]TFE19168.1 hypothetical protein E2980_23720 [Cohnella luojiensis]
MNTRTLYAIGAEIKKASLKPLPYFSGSGIFVLSDLLLKNRSISTKRSGKGIKRDKGSKIDMCVKCDKVNKIDKIDKIDKAL